jgi:hypothetical protein
MNTSRLHGLARVLCFALVLGAAPSFATHAHAQESTPVPADRLARNSIYVELLGSGILYSINYDRRFTDRVSGRAGAMLIGAKSEEGEQVSVALVPVMANYLAGHGSHRLEVGAGPVFAYAGARLDVDQFEGFEDLSAFGLFGGATLGYRYQPLRGGFTFRVGFTPLFASGAVAPTGGISFGYAF